MEPKRKINRLTEYDYAQSGAYFITICTHGRQKILWDSNTFTEVEDVGASIARPQRVIGDAIQLAISGTTGIGSLAGSLLNTGYNIVSGTRAYEADRADTAWNQQMQEKQRQDSLTQQRYENEASERAYQDALKQQAFNNSVTSEKLNIAKGEWALKQSNAQAKASRAAGNAAAKSSGSGKASGSAAGTTGGTAGTNALKGSSVVPFTAALLRSRGKSDTSIANALQKEGYTTSEIAKILQQMNQ